MPVQQFEARIGEGGQGELDGERYWLGNRTLASKMHATLSESMHQQLQRLEAAGNTVMLLGRGAVLLGLLAVADTVRPEARQTVERLLALQIAVVSVCGHNPHPTEPGRRQPGPPRGRCSGERGHAH